MDKMFGLHFDRTNPIFDRTLSIDRPLFQSLMLVYQVGSMAVELFSSYPGFYRFTALDWAQARIHTGFHRFTEIGQIFLK